MTSGGALCQLWIALEEIPVSVQVSNGYNYGNYEFACF